MGFSGVRAGLAVAAAAVLLAGCTGTVGGTAAPVPGQGPVKPVVDPCRLLDQPQADGLGYQVPGHGVPASEAQRAPAMCLWHSKDDTQDSVILNVGWAVGQTLEDYLQGAVVKAPPVKLGGLDWTRYGSFIPGSCDLYTTLGAKSYAFVSVSFKDEDRACELAKLTIPQVAAHLPGGRPAPPITPPVSSSPAQPSGPLATLDPCTLLKPEQAAQLKMQSTGRKNTSQSPTANVTYCLWDDTDGDRGQKAFEVWLGPDVPVTKWVGMDVPPIAQVDAGGRTWSVFGNFNDSGGVNCAAGLALGDTSSVEIVSGYLDDPAHSCDAVKAGIPLVTANLPA
ncbi:DUF3558 family protein [Amycolatopsis sp. PS_44_ISF1]|uniref:DUF3558 family protein n=1 Tax=Amycolatopsis sp. PS_44_ISF1 TaxID=2974917 RepID=UPI0028DE5778|nr:DUF3558 family protein [Amycolatopsis sp. PS_44_ISF1]MDT8910294.1 DUF3558 domain-containing protein [Amycolatopsis sp. PS_44_ISF1]